MPGLINDTAYDAARISICENDPRAERAFDAAEWALLAAKTTDAFDVVSDTSRGVIYGFKIPETESTPGLLIVLAVERFEGTEKWVLLDAELTKRIEHPPRRVRRTKSTK